MATRIDREGTTQALWLGLTLRVLIGLGIAWLLYRMLGALGLVFAAPVWGALLAKPILEGISTFIRGLRAAAFADWDGELMIFETHRLRIALVGGYPWIVDADLLAVLGDKPSDTLRRRYDAALCARLPDTKLWGFSEAGAIKLLRASRHPDAHKLRLLLERQVFLPARKRRERAAE